MNAEESATVLAQYPLIVEMVKRSVECSPIKGSLQLPLTEPSEWSQEKEMTKLERALNHHFAPRYIFFVHNQRLHWQKKPIPMAYRELAVGPGRETTAPGFDKNCPLCSKAYARNDVLTQLKDCSHAFHSICLAAYFTNADKCPSCP
jgi:hypothetical protein